mmetsp:Transcript_2368/g.8450  ORF Transcript_2368/g.8450 Transcript_2368/m.8450 type:complete len:343 (-) Transcript_2368:108-1136(-)
MTFSLFAPNASSSSLSPSSIIASILSRSCFRGFSVVPSSFFTTVTPLNLTVNVFASPSSNTSVAHVLHTSFNAPTAVAFFETTFGVHLIDTVISSSLFTIFGSTPPANPNSSYSLLSSSPSNRYSQIFQFRFVSLTIFTRSSADVVISTTPNLTTGTSAIERSDKPSFFASLSFVFFFVFFSSKLFLLLLLLFKSEDDDGFSSSYSSSSSLPPPRCCKPCTVFEGVNPKISPELEVLLRGPKNDDDADAAEAPSSFTSKVLSLVFWTTASEATAATESIATRVAMVFLFPLALLPRLRDDENSLLGTKFRSDERCRCRSTSSSSSSSTVPYVPRRIIVDSCS